MGGIGKANRPPSYFTSPCFRRSFLPPFYFRGADRDGVIDGGDFVGRGENKWHVIPPIGTRRGEVSPVSEKGSRTQSTTPHKNDNAPQK